MLLDSLGYQAPEISPEDRAALLNTGPGLDAFSRHTAPILSQDDQAAQTKAAQEQQDKQDNPLNLWTAAVTGLPTSFLIRQIQRNAGTATVPGYAVSEDELKSAVGFGKQYGLDPHYWNKLLEAISPGDLEELRQQAYTQQYAEQKIASYGNAGAIVQFAAGFTDPLSYAAFAATDGTAAILGSMKLAGPIGSAVRNGLVATAAIGPINAYVASQDPNITAKDVMHSTFTMMVAGSLLGAGFHGKGAEASRITWLKNRAEAASKVADRLEFDALKEANGSTVPDLTDAGKARYAEHIQDDADLEALANHVADQDRANAAQDRAAAFMVAEQRLAKSAPGKRLNRSEVDSVLEHTGYTAANQGFPTTEEMANHLADLRDFGGGDLKGSAESPVVTSDELTSLHGEMTGAAKTEVPPTESQAVPPEPAARGGLQIGDQVETKNGGPGRIQGFTQDGKVVVNIDGKHTEVPASEVQSDLQGMGTASPSTIDVEQNGPPRANKRPGDFDLSNASNARGWSIHDLPLFQAIAKAPLGDIPYVSAALEATRSRIGKLLSPFDSGLGKLQQMLQSDNPTARRAGRGLAWESVINKPGEPTTMPGSIWVDNQHKLAEAKAADAVRKPFESWAQRKGGMTPLNREKYSTEFQDAVTRYRTDRISTDPDIVKAGKSFDKFYSDYRGEGIHYGLKGFWVFIKDKLNPDAEAKWQPLPENENYSPRVYSGPKIADHTQNLMPEVDPSAPVVPGVAPSGKNGLQGYLERALNDFGTGWLTPARRTILAKVVMRLGETPLLTSIESGGMFSKDMAEELRIALRKSGADQELIDNAMNLMRPSDSRASMMSEAMPRIDFDETYTEAMKTKDGKEIALNFRDLLENDASKLHSRYARHLYGQIAAEESYRSLSPASGPRIRTMQGALDRISQDGKDFGMTNDQINGDLKNIEAMYKHVLGLPQDPGVGPVAEAALRDLRNIQRMRIFGMAMFKHLGNFATAMVESPSIEAILETGSHIPNILKDLRANVPISDPLLRELRQYVASTNNGFELGSVTGIIDRDATTTELRDKISKGIERGANFVGNIEGLLPMIHAQQDAVVLGEGIKWGYIAKSDKLPSARRLASQGLSRADGEKIIAAILHPENGYKWRDTDMGGPIIEFNLHKWDPETRSLFANALNLSSRRIVLNGDIGQMSKWMDTAWGKSMMQGRFFHGIAWENRVRFGLRMMDPQAAFSFAAEMGTGAAAYALRIQAQSVGRKDRDAFLKERLSPASVAKAAFASNGYTSLFPIGIDSVADMTGFYPKQFSYTRTTGQGQAIWDNPTLQFAGGMMGPVPRSIINLIHPGRVKTQEDIKNARYLIPAQNMPIWGNLLDYVESRFPNKKPSTK